MHLGLRWRARGRNLSLTAEKGKKKGLSEKAACRDLCQPTLLLKALLQNQSLTWRSKPGAQSESTQSISNTTSVWIITQGLICNILIPQFFFNFQFSWSLMRWVDVIAKPQLIMTGYRSNEIISLSASQHTFRRDISQHHTLWIYRRNDDFIKGRLSSLPTRGRRAVVFSCSLTEDSHRFSVVSLPPPCLTSEPCRCELWVNDVDAMPY